MNGKPSKDSAAPSSPGATIVPAHMAVLLDQLISRAGLRSCNVVFDMPPAALAVLRLAAEVEPEPMAMLEWYRHTPIAEFGELTAEKLVAMDHADRVIAFLRSISDGTRD